MFDILFVHANGAPIIYQDLYKSYSAREVPIWAGMLANSCRIQGHEVAILDCECEQLTTEESVKRILDIKPRIVCFVVYGQQPSAGTQNMWGATETSKLLKLYDPMCKTVFVGPHMSSLPRETMETEPSIDMLAINEGVYCLWQLLKAKLDDEIELQKVQGLVWRDKEGNIRFNEPSKIIPKNRLHLDLPGQAFDLLPNINKYRTSPWHSWSNNTENAPFASLYTSLGCPYTCHFCLDGNTKLITSNQPNKKISKIVKGDKLIGWDEERSEMAETIVMAVSSRFVDSILEIELDNGKKIKSTEEHPFFVNGKWVNAKDLLVGDNVLVIDPNDKIAFNKKLYNPMKNEEAQRKVSVSLKKLYKTGVLVSPFGDSEWRTKHKPFSKNLEKKEEHYKNISERMKTNNPMFCEETRQRAAETYKKRLESGEIVPYMCTEEGRSVISRIAKDRADSDKNPLLYINMTPEQIEQARLNASTWSKERWNTPGYREQQIKAGNIFMLSGSAKYVQWKGGISFGEYGVEFNKTLKNEVKTRDGFACRECGDTQARLDIHHIDYDKTNNKKCNLITLCQHCHMRTNFNREVWEKKYKEVMLLVDTNCPHYVKIKSIKTIEGNRQVYNVRCEPHNNYFAEYILTHNCMINVVNRTKLGDNISSADSNVFRWWDPEFIITEFDKLASMGVRNLKIADELFVLNPRHFMKICDLLIERGYGFNIWAYSRIDTCKPEYLEKLKKAGVNWLGLGIENPSQTIRKEVHKDGFKEVKIDDLFKMMRVAGINIGANYIFGLPNDTIESMKYTLEFMMNNLTENMNCYSAMAYPGSPLYFEARKNGLKLPEKYSGYSQHSYDTTCLPTKYLTASEVLRFRDEAWIKYFTYEPYLKMMEDKFGQKCRQNIEATTKVKLKRKLLGD